MKRLAIAVALLVLLCGLVAPSALAKEPVGERLFLLGEEVTSFPANTPFFVQHGWGLEKEAVPRGLFDFRLSVDGSPVAADFVLTHPERDPWLLYRMRTFNFPQGMTGTHTLTAEWIAPCAWATTYGSYSGTCASRNELVITTTRTHTITFGE